MIVCVYVCVSLCVCEIVGEFPFYNHNFQNMYEGYIYDCQSL